jgi:hypothetical protein
MATMPPTVPSPRTLLVDPGQIGSISATMASTSWATNYMLVSHTPTKNVIASWCLTLIRPALDEILKIMQFFLGVFFA